MSKKAKKPVTKIYNVRSENDGNDSFWVEANTPEEAASKALEVLGWGIYDGVPGKLDEKGEPVED